MRWSAARIGVSAVALALLAPVGAQAASIDLKTGFQTRFAGLSSAGNSGHAQAIDMAENAGDVNGDGIPDALVGDGGQFQDFDGAVFIVYGQRSPTRRTINPQNGLSASQGYRIDGPDGQDAYGSSIANVGDVSGDGVPDALIGNGNQSDGVFLVYGQRSATPQTIDLDSLTPAQGVFIFGGPSVSGACAIGDVNGDGIPDMGLSGNNGGQGQPGSVFILFGRRPNGSLEINLSQLTPQQGYLIRGSGIEQLNCDGGSANAGDVNRDGVPDQVLGAPAASPNGAGSGIAYVIFGQRTAAPVTIRTDQLTQAQGYRIQGAAASAGLEAAAGTGDVNGDGVPDQIVGAPGTFTSDPDQMIPGAAFVVYGQRNAATVNLAKLTSATGYRISDSGLNATAGFAVAGAGDVNLDGVPDQLVGAIAQGSTASVAGPGAAFVVYGQRTRSPQRIDLANLASERGYAINGATVGDEAGYWVANAGDVDGDRQADQLVVAPAANPIAPGTAAAARAPARAAGERFTTGYTYTVLALPPLPPVATPISARTTVDGRRRAQVVLRCSARARCTGRLTLFRRGRAVSTSERYAIAAGARITLRPTLAAGTHAVLRRSGRLAVRARAVTDRPGPGSTVRDRPLGLVFAGFTG